MSAILLRRRTSVMVTSKPSYENDYLQINSLGNGDVTIDIPSSVSSTIMTSISWSKDRINWTDLIIDNTYQVITVPVANNETVFIKGDGKRTFYRASARITITSSANYDISGNIMSLLYGDDFINKTSFPDDSTHTFYGLFDGSTTVINAKNLILPATTLTTCCYYSMFENCTNLVSAPKLPATTLALSCYYYMFKDTAIVKAPTLSADTLTNNCYRGMFYNCNNLNYVKMLATDISASSCLQAWLNNVSPTGTFVKNRNATWDVTGSSGVPTGWTIELADN